MTDTPSQKTFETLFREWTQFILILFAAGWGVYTFVYKEFTVPKSAPINISMTLEARNLGVRVPTLRAKEQPLQAVELRITARNPSARNIHLLRNVWVAAGLTVTQHDADDDASMKQEFANGINSSDELIQVWRHSAVETSEVVAAGILFVDDELRPGESIARTIVFFVPRGAYDLIEVSTHIPSVAIAGIDLEWEVQDDFAIKPHLFRMASIKPRLFRGAKDSPRTEIPSDKAGHLSDRSLEYQLAVSRSSISLWR
jgi:hypothetical protein